MPSEAYERIESFIESFQHEIHRIVVPAEDWEDIKNDAERGTGEKGLPQTTIHGVQITWSADYKTPQARVLIE